MTRSAHAALEPCPSCGGTRFARASLYAAGRFSRPEPAGADERESLIATARAEATQSGPHLVLHDSGERKVVLLAEGNTRIGRSLTAEIRFDDQTVSRKHALLIVEGGEVRVLDDRSLNGIFVNGERVENRILADGDEVVVGRHRLYFLDVTADIAAGIAEGLQSAG